MDVRTLIQRYGMEYVGRYYSRYRAMVVENNDPNKQGRLFVYIPSVFDGVQAWAYSAGTHGGPNTGFKYLTPPIGSTVWVTFEKGHPLYPVWEYHGWYKDQVPDELNDVYTAGFVTPNGNKILLSETDGQLTIEINGDAILKTPGDYNISIKDLNLKGKTLNSETEGNTNFNFKEFIFNKGNIGIPQSTDVSTRLNLIEAKVNQIMVALSGAQTAIGDGGATYKAQVVAALGSPLIPTTVANIASKTIKQTE